MVIFHSYVSLPEGIDPRVLFWRTFGLIGLHLTWFLLENQTWPWKLPALVRWIPSQITRKCCYLHKSAVNPMKSSSLFLALMMFDDFQLISWTSAAVNIPWKSLAETKKLQPPPGRATEDVVHCLVFATCLMQRILVERWHEDLREHFERRKARSVLGWRAWPGGGWKGWRNDMVKAWSFACLGIVFRWFSLFIWF